MSFKTGDRVCADRGLRGTVVHQPPRAVTGLIMVKWDGDAGGGTSFMAPSSLMHLNPVEWLAEIARPRRRWKPGERVRIHISGPRYLTGTVRDDNGGHDRAIAVKLDDFVKCRHYSPEELEPGSVIESLASLA